MDELKLKYVQLMRDAHLSLGDEDANSFDKKSIDIWDKPRNPKVLDL
ncbi:hypothetical protein [Prochlorococcus sp. MIT 0801]|nr:hypothetical protein [Prochlorococcus sp. MIT 0801]AIQ97510.1 hypothetical protein EW15_1418 [Prochlorococcus sp. MIT 0801]